MSGVYEHKIIIIDSTDSNIYTLLLKGVVNGNVIWGKFWDSGIRGVSTKKLPAFF